MISILPFVAGVAVSFAAAYLRIGLRAWSLATAAAIVVAGLVAGAGAIAIALPLLLLALVAVPLNLVDFRRRKLTAPLLAAFRKVTPQLSDTEQVALDAGSVGFEGELFSGKPDWSQLLAQPKPALSVEEQAFLDGPVERLCAMIDDWQIRHSEKEIPQPIWDFVKKHGYLGMLISKAHGGLGFSPQAQSLILGKIAPYVVIGYVQMSLVFLVGRLVFRVPFVGSFGLLYGLASVFIAANLALGLFFSTVARTQQQAMQMSFFFLLPNILLSGFMFPFAAMPRFAQVLSTALPLTHFLRIIRGVVLKGAGFAEVAPEVLALAVILSVLVLLTSLRFRKKLG